VTTGTDPADERTSATAATATVTVAVPLHASGHWVDNVVDNVRRLPDLVTEIVVSDRTLVDDAADRLRLALADDERVVVRAEALGIGWPEHYQLLLEEAQGDLFMWMPHDDIFDASWVPVLSGALARHPEAWLAFGRIEPVELDGVSPGPRPPYHPRPGLVTPARAAHLGIRGMGVGFRGLIRRQDVLASGLRVDRPAGDLDDPAADIAWVLAVALRSGLVYDDRTTTRKRYYGSSTSARWRRPAFSDVRQTLAVADAHLPTGGQGRRLRMLMWLGIVRWACRRPIGMLINPLRDRWHRTVALRDRSMLAQ
jgi:GT2 family glycosyltransferase